jgi:hypothetical protein
VGNGKGGIEMAVNTKKDELNDELYGDYIEVHTGGDSNDELYGDSMAVYKGNGSTNKSNEESPVLNLSKGNSQYTNTNKSYNPNTDYQTLINDAVGKNDYKTAAIYEQLRNQKILGEGLDYDTTNLYGGYLDSFGQQKNQQDALDVYNQYMQNRGEKNAKPTEPERDARIDRLLNQILNRGDFSYDASSDPLYQQYAEMYKREGDRAMRETLAEAASGAGGMNSYAITAAQQANNYYNSQLNDKIPELYQLAYQMYLQDKESMVQDLGLLQDMDAAQYNRYRDTINDYYNDKNFAYGVYQDAVNQGNWQTDFNYNAMVNDRDFNYNDVWNNKEWERDQTRYDKEWERDQTRYDNEWERDQTRYDNEWNTNQAWKEKEWNAYENEWNTNQAWKEKEWNAAQEETAYNKDIYARESAKEEVWKLIQLGVTPSTDLIAKAGMSEDDVTLAAEAVAAMLARDTRNLTPLLRN